MANSLVPVLLAACFIAASCDGQPTVTFLAKGDDGNLFGLTDDAGSCDAPARLAYLTALDGASLRGCWVRDRSQIRVRFNDTEDRRVPVGDFRRTETAEYRNLSLD